MTCLVLIAILILIPFCFCILYFLGKNKDKITKSNKSCDNCCLEANIFKPFVFTLIIWLIYHIAFGDTILYAATPEDLDNLKSMIEYNQDQIYTIDQDIREAGLNKNDSELTHEQLEMKKEALQGKKECEENRRHFIKQYSEAKSQAQQVNDSDGSSSKKRPR